MPLYGFDEESVGRIGETVRLVESGRTKGRKNGTDKSPRGSVGVRCMLGKIGTAAWSKASSATVTIYAGEPGSEASAETMTAYNYVADIPESTSSSRYVVLSNNGFGWIAIESESSVSLGTATMTYVSDITIAAVQSTANCSITVTKTLITASITYATI